MSYNVFRFAPGENENKGLDIIIKTLNSKYPFITGWEYNTSSHYETLVHINLFVDVNKLSEYFKLPINKNFEVYEFLQKANNFCGPLNLGNYSPEKINDEPCMIFTSKVRKLINKYHKYLPEKYKTHTRITYNGELNPDWKGEVSFDVETIFFKK